MIPEVLSPCHTKRRVLRPHHFWFFFLRWKSRCHMYAYPSFFWYDNEFRDLFAWHLPYVVTIICIPFRKTKESSSLKRKADDENHNSDKIGESEDRGEASEYELHSEEEREETEKIQQKRPQRKCKVSPSPSLNSRETGRMRNNSHRKRTKGKRVSKSRRWTRLNLKTADYYKAQALIQWLIIDLWVILIVKIESY